MNSSFRTFKVTRKVQESSNICSFYLAPVDGKPLPPVRAGQYLTLKIPTPDGHVLKTYSISTDAEACAETRITVKRETAPPHQPELPEGVGSCWLHDHAEAGTEIDIAAARGAFVLDQKSQRPVVLLSGGVGQTPLLSMLHSLARTERSAFYIHACENGDVHAMRDEVAQLASETSGRIKQHVCYRTPSAEDKANRRFDSEGVVDKALLQSLLPLDSYDFYLCGPTAFMVAVYQLLSDLGVSAEHIAYEFFGKGTSLPTLVAAAKSKQLQAQTPAYKTPANAPAALASLVHLTDPDARAAADDVLNTQDNTVSQASADTAEIVFARSGVTAEWTDADSSLLELAERAGLTPDFSCRSGICNSCVCNVIEGDVEYAEEPLTTPDNGTALLCCSRPRGRLVLDI